MKTADKAAVETKLHAFWERLLSESLEDARTEKVDSEAMAMFPETMVHVGLARMAEQQGAGRIAAQLRMIAEKFANAAAGEQTERKH